MSPLDAFGWGVMVGALVLRLLSRAHERMVERRASIASEHAKLLQRKLDETRAAAHELLASRVELAFNFYAMRRAARDEVQS